MPQGLQIWDASGNKLVDVTSRFTRYLGQFQTGTSDGTYYDDNLLLGTAWYIVTTTYGLDSMGALELTATGNHISWSFGSTISKKNQIITYGVFL